LCNKELVTYLLTIITSADQQTQMKTLIHWERQVPSQRVSRQQIHQCTEAKTTRSSTTTKSVHCA